MNKDDNNIENKIDNSQEPKLELGVNIEQEVNMVAEVKEGVDDSGNKIIKAASRGRHKKIVPSDENLTKALKQKCKPAKF